MNKYNTIDLTTDECLDDNFDFPEPTLDEVIKQNLSEFPGYDDSQETVVVTDDEDEEESTRYWSNSEFFDARELNPSADPFNCGVEDEITAEMKDNFKTRIYCSTSRHVSDNKRVISFDDRKRRSETFECPEYIPFFSSNPMGYWMSYTHFTSDLWEESMDGKVEEFIAMLVRERDGVIEDWLIYLHDNIRPPVLKSIAKDLLGRYLYAKGKCSMIRSTNLLTGFELFSFSDDFYDSRPHKKCVWEWRPVNVHRETCICDPSNTGGLADKADGYCCYTNVLGRNQTGRILLLGTKEDVECIKCIQKMYMPLTGITTDFLSVDRFSADALVHGLIIKPNIPWNMVFDSVKEVPSFHTVLEHTGFTRLMVTLLLTAEWINRPSRHSMFPWEYFSVTELIPKSILDERLAPVIDTAIDTIFNKDDIAYAAKVVNEGGENVFESHLLSRSIPDGFENNCHFQCHQCDTWISGRSVTMMGSTNVDHITINDALVEAINESITGRLFCDVYNTMGLHQGAMEDHVLEPGCCANHMTRKLCKITYDAEACERVCLSCLTDKNKFIFLGRATFDGARIGSNKDGGGWWIDLKRFQGRFINNRKRAESRSFCHTS